MHNVVAAFILNFVSNPFMSIVLNHVLICVTVMTALILILIVTHSDSYMTLILTHTDTHIDSY